MHVGSIGISGLFKNVSEERFMHWLIGHGKASHFYWEHIILGVTTVWDACNMQLTHVTGAAHARCQKKIISM
jgi:hypothetical protein